MTTGRVRILRFAQNDNQRRMTTTGITHTGLCTGRSSQMKHLLRRIGFYLVALWASITINFVIPRLAPGDPAGALMARFQGRMNPQAISALKLQFGLTNDPLWIQYIHYLNNLLHGNLGTS